MSPGLEAILIQPWTRDTALPFLPQMETLDKFQASFLSQCHLTVDKSIFQRLFWEAAFAPIGQFSKNLISNYSQELCIIGLLHSGTHEEHLDLLGIC